MTRQLFLPFAQHKPSCSTRPAKRRHIEAIDIEDDDSIMVDISDKDDTPERFIIIDDEDEDEDRNENDTLRELNPSEKIEVIDLEALLSKVSISDVPAGYRRRDSVTAPTGALIQSGSNVELENGDFVRVVDILQHSQDDIRLRGILLRRTRHVHDFLRKARNELCIILKDVQGAADPSVDSSLVLCSLDEVVQERKIVFTNRPYPDLSFRSDPWSYIRNGEWQNQMIEENAVLVCRWKYAEYIQDSKVVEEAVFGLRECEADPGRVVSDSKKKADWTSNTSQRSNAHPAKKPCMDSRQSSEVIDLTEQMVDLTEGDTEEETIEIRHLASFTRRRKDGSVFCTSTESKVREVRRPAQRSVERIRQYIVGDVCAGAGGMMSGAVQAGLQPGFALDHWEAACDTLERNFLGAKILRMDIFKFCTRNGTYIVDILHVSFPCQTYSWAHTRDGKNDDANSAAGYSVGPILEKTKPRVVTFEQTSGFLQMHKNKAAFAALIHQLTSKGYNVRWKIFNCAEYGNVQPRKRLFIIASCPGEPLPPFPKPTHGGSAHKPFVTIKQRLDLLPPKRLMEPHMRLHTDKKGTPFNPNRQLRRCITTDGGEDSLHFSGNRGWDMSELAVLGGFPATHKFANALIGDLRRQIGNAVPSMVAKKIFEEVKRSMMKEDEAEQAVLQANGGENGRSVDTAFTIDDAVEQGSQRRSSTDSENGLSADSAFTIE